MKNINNTKNKIERITALYSESILPLVLAVTLVNCVFSTYGQGVFSVWTIAQIIVCAFAFLLGAYTNTHRVKGGALVFIVTFVIIAAYSFVTRGNDYGYVYRQWFMSGGDIVEARTEYYAALLLIFGYFFGVVIYYFSRVLFRMVFLALVSMIPFMLQVKTSSDISMSYVLVVTLLNLAIFIVHRKKASKAKIYFKKNLAASYIIFMTLVGVLAVALPKKTETRFYYMFEDTFLGGNMSVTLPESYSDLSEYSGNADSYNEFYNRKLYSVYADDLLYLKTQTFDYYDFEKNAWYAAEGYSEPFYDVNEYLLNQNNLNLWSFSKILEYVTKYNSNFTSKYNVTELYNNPVNDDGLEMEIDAENFTSISLPVPSRIYALNTSYNSSISVTKNGDFIKASIPNDRYEEDVINYYDDMYAVRSFIEKGGASFSDEEALAMLNEAYITASKNSSLVDVISAYISRQQEADAYKALMAKENDKIPERVRALAQEITKDCTYDYEKAQALCDYFDNNGFKYDLDYKAPDDSVEYFLFTGKTGTCSDYATAYVLMARSVGLNVRYAEGFVTSYTGIENTFNVKISDSHAYPEVFIQNVGYIPYESTVSAQGENHAFDTNMENVMAAGYYTLRILLAAALAVSVILLFILLLLPSFRELAFGIRFATAKKENKPVFIYRRLLDKSEGIIGDAVGCLTPYEFAERFHQKTGYDIEEIAGAVVKAVYVGDVQISDKEIKQIKMSYRISKKLLRTAKKKLNK